MTNYSSLNTNYSIFTNVPSPSFVSGSHYTHITSVSFIYISITMILTWLSNTDLINCLSKLASHRLLLSIVSSSIFSSPCVASAEYTSNIQLHQCLRTVIIIQYACCHDADHWLPLQMALVYAAVVSKLCKITVYWPICDTRVNCNIINWMWDILRFTLSQEDDSE